MPEIMSVNMHIDNTVCGQSILHEENDSGARIAKSKT